MLDYIQFTDKEENTIFLIYKEIQNGAVAKLYMTNGLIESSYLVKYLRISYHTWESPFSYMTLQPIPSEFNDI